MNLNRISVLNKKTGKITHITTYEPCLTTMATAGFTVTHNTEFNIIECENSDVIISFPVDTFIPRG
ncbi:MAG: hypothetical protein ACRCSJ_06545 [Cetobacterium sp.]